MIKGKTEDGFKFEIDERILDDWRLVDAIGLADSDDASEQIRGMRETINFILGDQFENLKKHISSKNGGYIPREKVTDMVSEIIRTAKELKNSSSSEG